MNTHSFTRHPSFLLLIACAVFPLLLSACQPVLQATQPVADPTVDSTVEVITDDKLELAGEITLDLTAVAQGQTVETVAAVPASPNAMWWAAGPQYDLMTLQGYPVTTSSVTPQIFIYPVDELAAANENAGKIITDLQTLLQTQQAGDELPYLPLVNAKQVIHAQVQYLNFKNGSGVRFLTQYSQGIYPINNVRLVYTFQGLTGDGQYYIAAVLPVTHPDLPATDAVSEQTGEEYRTQLAETAAWLDQQPGASFTPDLAKLDAMIQSIEVK